MRHSATHCNTLQHIETHCNTLQHTATHCNTLSVELWRTLWCDITHTRTTSKYNIHICKSWKVTVFTKNGWSWHTFHSRYTQCVIGHTINFLLLALSLMVSEREKAQASARARKWKRETRRGREGAKFDIWPVWNTSTGGCRGQHLFWRPPLTAIVSVSLLLSLALSCSLSLSLSFPLSPTRGTFCWKLHYNYSVWHFVCSTFYFKFSLEILCQHSKTSFRI